MKCPICEGEMISRSHRQGLFEYVPLLLFRRPYRCRACERRFWSFVWRQRHKDPLGDAHKMLGESSAALDRPIDLLNDMSILVSRMSDSEKSRALKSHQRRIDEILAKTRKLNLAIDYLAEKLKPQQDQ